MDDLNHLHILDELERIEREEQVRILFACESGSRAWGFPSKDSDYDVRFIYVRPVDWYLSLFEKRDVIERPVSDRLDINGWDLRKALNLFRKSNPPLLEWLQSPMIYREEHAVIEQIRRLSLAAFSPKSCLYHYLHMAKGNYRDYLQGDLVKVKKYLYVLRPILACEWIEKKQTLPPVAFNQLIEATVPESSELKSVIERLLIRKRTGGEWGMEPKIRLLNSYIEEKIHDFDRLAAEMPASGDNQDQLLDDMFRSVLKESWN